MKEVKIMDVLEESTVYVSQQKKLPIWIGPIGGDESKLPPVNGIVNLEKRYFKGILLPKGYWNKEMDRYIITSDHVRYLFWESFVAKDAERGVYIEYHKDVWPHVLPEIKSIPRVMQFLGNSIDENFEESIKEGRLVSFNFNCERNNLNTISNEISMTNLGLYRDSYIKQYIDKPKFKETFIESWEVLPNFHFKSIIDKILNLINEVTSTKNSKVKMVNYPTFKDKQTPKVHDLRKVKLNNEFDDWKA